MAKTMLPNGCAHGKISVHPINWEKAGASCKCDWYIHYRFYDLRLAKSKAVQIRGMNEYTNLEDRRRMTRKYIADELELIRDQGYNRITQIFERPLGEDETHTPGVLSELSPFGEALDLAKAMLKLSPATMTELSDAVTQAKAAAGAIREKGGYLVDLPVKDVRKPHMRASLEKIAINRITGAYSPDKFNRHRTALMILYTEMEELDVVEINIPGALRKKKTIKKIRDTLTAEQRQVINNWLREHYPHFWRAVHIFFHSGARERELLDVRREHVDLKRQVVKYLVLKGGQHREVERAIKDSVLHLWRELMDLAGPGDYLFSKGLVPGPSRIRNEQFRRYWYRHVKNKKKDRDTGKKKKQIVRIPIEVTADLYSLKHTHSTELKQELGAKATAAHNAHSEDVLNKYYDVARRDDQTAVKQSAVGFAPADD